jgi:hypothetical protein
MGPASQPASTCRHDGHGVDLHRESLWSWLPAGVLHAAHPWDVLGYSICLCVGDLARGRNSQGHCEEVPEGMFQVTRPCWNSNSHFFIVFHCVAGMVNSRSYELGIYIFCL